MTQEPNSGGAPTRSQVLWTLGIGVFLTITFLVALGYGKTPWDWLKVLIIPAVIAIGGFLLNRAQSERELEIAEQRAETDRDIAEQRAQDNALQAYLDQMSQLLADKGLRNKEHWLDDARVTARARSLTVLRQLSSERKRSVLQFLYEAQLINEAEKPGPDDDTLNARIVGLSGADLREANLRYISLEGAALDGAILENADLREAKLSGIDLGGAFLSGADLSGGYLSKASLREAQLQRKEELNLRGADLSGADLSDADLTGANITEEQLATCKSLVGATMPDGSIHD